MNTKQEIFNKNKVLAKTNEGKQFKYTQSP